MAFVSSNGNQFTVWILPIKGVREENGIYHLEVVAIDELPQFSSSPLNVDPKPHNGLKPYRNFHCLLKPGFFFILQHQRTNHTIKFIYWLISDILSVRTLILGFEKNKLT
jgi:hypothetical protein